MDDIKDAPTGGELNEPGGDAPAAPTDGNGAGAVQTLTRKDFASDQEVRWCPGCGDYAVLSAVQGVMPALGIPREKIVFVSGIGCSSRFPYYMNTYGFHSIHGRAPAIASGVVMAHPELSVWVVTGDGDGLSIGGNHLIHALRRNMNLKILLFNNEIYGLTKGQYSPTSDIGKVTKSTPYGSLDWPFNPVSVALGVEATFVARVLDVDKPHLTEVLLRAAKHEGSAFVEIYQNCPVFNDDQFIALTGKDTKAINQIRLKHGEPIIFGPDGVNAVVWDKKGGVKIAETASVDAADIVVHDEHAQDAGLAFSLSRLSHQPTGPTPIGIFRDVQRPVYDVEMERQVAAAQVKQGKGELAKLLVSGNTWEVTD
ncbi:MAG: 2-oxoacid:ferredoxin oxidoreductase subunit beta [Actinobacteria bacterium]|nr:2-oxoacid:ferredoxin oxidoreductase subunit beta [Actinomycetota bacterium]